jgi:hypothetical protein
MRELHDEARLSALCTMNSWTPRSLPLRIKRAYTTLCVAIRPNEPGHHCAERSDK